jgi:methylmalonyl-CoA mutase N-terminal domain/subunit
MNLIPAIIDAVKAGATTGEVSNVVREAYGEFHPKTVF